MRCPRCETPTLVEKDREGITIDVCPTCRGVWLDRGELEKLISKAVAELDEMAAGVRPNQHPAQAAAAAPAPAPQPAPVAPPPPPPPAPSQGPWDQRGAHQGTWRDDDTDRWEKGYHKGRKPDSDRYPGVGPGGHGHPGPYGHPPYKRKKSWFEGIGDIFD